MAKGKSLPSSFADLAADLGFADTTGSSTGNGSVTGWEKSVTAQNPSKAGNLVPSICELRPWQPQPLREREPNQRPEYPRRGVDCPRIFFDAPASGLESRPARRPPSFCTQYSRFPPTGSLRRPWPLSLCC